MSEIDWSDPRGPRAAAFDDGYFGASDARGESEHVFLRGAELPAHWASAPSTRIGELGFGLGLNFCVTWAAWRAARKPPGATLRYDGFEAAPPEPADIVRAAARWPDLGPLAAALASAWPPTSGDPIRLDDGAVTLRVWIGDANAMVPAWDGEADAWFLDGFSPAKNPELWTAPLMAAVAARTRPGGAATTYSAAGWVRRNLAAAGLEVRKQPGFGRKREMCVAWKPLPRATPPDEGNAASTPAPS